MSKSSFWDRIAHNSGNQEPGELTLLTIRSTAEHLSPSDHVLDVGCGTGVFTLALSEYADHVTGMDTSVGMIEVARERAKQQGVKNVTFEHRSLDDQRFQSGQFQVVTAFNVLHHMSDLDAELRRIYDLLPSGGTFISSTACLGERFSFMRIMLLVSTWLGLVPKMNFFRPIQLEESMRSVGFDVVDSDELSALPDHYVVAKRV